MTTTPARTKALALLKEYTKGEGLIRHCLSVEACMRWHARQFGEDEELWGITGLLHDFDYEMHPQQNINGANEKGHPYVGVKILKEQGYPEIMCEAIMGHALYSGVLRTTPLAKTLFACDELSGLVYASVLVRPDKSIENLEVKSVKKKMKDKAFAKGVSRDDIQLGAEEMGVEVDEMIENVITAMREGWEEIHS
jgi:putative nucleotidyltransferase with HDIG domain